MSEIDETLISEEEQQIVDEIVDEHQQSKDPLDNIDDIETMRAEAKKFRGIVNRKASQTQEQKPEEKKEAEPPKPAQEQINPAPAAPSAEVVTPEDLLRTTKGYDDDTLAELKAIAKGKDISLFKAQEDPLFTGFLERKEAADKAAKAKLGASQGSGKSATKRTFSSPGLTDEEHKEMWKEKQGL